VNLQQIEGDENDVLVVAAMPQAASRLQFVHSLDDERVAGSPVMLVPGQQPDARRHWFDTRHA